MSKVNRLRALMDLLLRRGANAFDSFCDVLFENEEFTAVEYLKPELMRKNKDGSASECLQPQQVSQSPLCPNCSGQKVHYTFHHKSTVLPKGGFQHEH